MRNKENKIKKKQDNCFKLYTLKNFTWSKIILRTIYGESIRQLTRFGYFLIFNI